MKKKEKNILAVAGVISAVMGIIGVVPSFLQNQLGLATASAFLIVVGLVLLAIAFGED